MALVAVPKAVPALIDREARRAHLIADDLRGITTPARPVVLVPTPAQLRRGQLTVDATDDQCPSAALARRALAADQGWTCRLTYSHALLPPKRGAEDWREVHTVALRLEHEARCLRGWAAWSDGGWGGAQVGAYTPADLRVDLLSIRSYGADGLGYLLRGIDPPVVEKATCLLCRKEGVRVKQDGALYAHKWLDGPCPGAVA